MTGERLSGLGDPATAVRRVGAAALSTEELVLLLAIQPIRVLGGELSGQAIALVVASAVAAVALAGMLRRRWAWYAASALQVALVAGGFLHSALAVLGVVFGLVWACVLYLRWRLFGVA